ncbi:MAG: response regulator [Nanoarchaeota archaeon]|nr:response regulator [Nanoarchaeota archaeon]
MIVSSALVVDDEPFIKDCVSFLLSFKYSNCKVLTASDGREALSLYKEDIDLIISDVSMPLLNGFEMAEEVLKIKSEQKIIIMSSDYRNNKEAQSLGLKFIAKPFDSEALIEIINEI